MLAHIIRIVQSPETLTFAGRGIQYFSQLIMVLVIPQALAPADFVELNLLLPLAYLGVSLAFSWLTGSLNRYVHELLAPDNSAIRQTAFKYYAGVSLLLFGLYLAFSLSTDSIYSLVPLLLIATGFKELILGILNISGNHKGYLSANLGYAASLVIFVGFCFYRENADLELYLTIYAIIDISVSLVAGYLLGLISINVPLNIDLSVLARYFRYGTPLVANSLAIWVMSLSDRYLLALWEPKETVAGYILSYQLGASIITVPMSFAVAVILPRIIRIDRDEGELEALHYTYRLLSLYLKYMMIIFACACAIVLPLKYYVYPAYEYNPAVLAVIVLAHVIYGLIHFYNKEFELNGRTIVITRAMAIGAAVNVLLNLMLIPPLGDLGAALGTLFAYIGTVYSVYKARQYRPVVT